MTAKRSDLCRRYHGLLRMSCAIATSVAPLSRVASGIRPAPVRGRQQQEAGRLDDAARLHEEERRPDVKTNTPYSPLMPPLPRHMAASVGFENECFDCWFFTLELVMHICIGQRLINGSLCLTALSLVIPGTLQKTGVRR